MTSFRIVGVDPGFDRIGVCIIDKKGDKETLIYSTCIITSRKDTFEKRLFTIGTSLEKIFTDYSPTELAIETLFFTKNQTTAILVAEMRGVCLYLAHKYSLFVHEYSPPQIKLAIAGHGKATKKDIEHMLPKILKRLLPQGLLDDELDAIAIALTHSAHRKMKTLTNTH